MMKCKEELIEIWELIPDFKCKQGCNKCCGPVAWSHGEDIVIQEYMKKHNIKYVNWTTEQYIENQLVCPYLKKKKCIIYPVRPVVCRLQGHIYELPCLHNNNYDISRQNIDKIYRKWKNVKNKYKEKVT